MSGSCTQMRRKLVSYGAMNIGAGVTNGAEVRSEWVTEPCGAPLFGAKGETLCRSCLSGWTHPNNYPVAGEGESEGVSP